MGDMGILMDLAEEIAELKARVAVLEAGGPATGTAKGSYTPAFEDWWKVYPRKESKWAAMVAWRKVDADLYQVVMAATGVYAKSEQGKGSFCPHGSTWLNARRWEDDSALWGRTDSGKQSLAEYMEGRGKRIAETRKLLET